MESFFGSSNSGLISAQYWMKSGALFTSIPRCWVTVPR